MSAERPPEHRRGPGTGALFRPSLAAALMLAACVHVEQPTPRALTAAEMEALVAELSLSPDAAVVVAAGDIARCDAIEHATATAELAAAVIDAAAGGAVITMGDHAYESGTPEELARCYGPTWGRFNSITYPTPGNHDFETDEGAPYYDYFLLYARNPSARQRGFYRFELGDWQLFALNSMLPLDAGSEQLEWLNEQLALAPAPCTLAYWHHPLVSSGWHGLSFFDRGRDTEAAWQALLAHDAELVLNGHDHIYERFEPQNAELEPEAAGLRQIIVGTGGGDLTRVLRQRAQSAFVYNRTHGILVLSLHADRYEWAFVGTDGIVHDRSEAMVPCR